MFFISALVDFINTSLLWDKELFKFMLGLGSKQLNVSVLNNRKKQDRHVQVYPNPVMNQLHIRATEGEIKLESIQVLDAQGRVIEQITPSAFENTKIDTDKWPANIYLLRLNYENGEKSQLKIVKR